MLQWKYGETESTVAIICGQHRGGEVSWFGQQAAEIRFLSTVPTEGWRSAADVEVFVVDSVRHKSHGVAELVASVFSCRPVQSTNQADEHFLASVT